MIAIREAKIKDAAIFATAVLWLAASTAFGATEFFIAPGTLPKRFYHWINHVLIERGWGVDQLESSGKLPLPLMKSDTLAADNLPALADKPGLFAWTNPVTGMATGPTERYGDVVIMMESTENPVNIMELRTSNEGNDGFGTPSYARVDMKKVDAIHHVRVDAATNQVIWEEWIITNPEAINYFTVDPKLIKPAVKTELERLHRGDEFKAEELHFKRAGKNQLDKARPLFNSQTDVKAVVLPVLESYMQKTAADFPAPWIKKRTQPLKNGCFDLKVEAGREAFESGI